MNEYENGKIYKVTDKNDNIIYIGSTKQKLKVRWNAHKLNCHENKIILIENYPCESREELRIYEQKFIDFYKELGLVNQCKAYLSEEERKQYFKKYDQSEKKKQYKKIYNQTDKRKESKKKYEQSEKCIEYRKKYKQSENYKQNQKFKANCPHCEKLMTKKYISEHTRLYCKDKPIDND